LSSIFALLQTYRVTQTYKSKAYGELSLKENEFLYASAITTKDNFIKAVSLSTGESGFFPNKYVERANETDTWVLHKSNLCISTNPTPIQTNLNETRVIEAKKAEKNGTVNGARSRSIFDKLLSNNESKQTSQASVSPRALPAITLPNSDNQFMQMRFNINQERSLQMPNLLRFFISRHGERIDLTFGAAWLDQAFDKMGMYRRTNLNMPQNLPIRNSKRDFIGKRGICF
jgi:ubiquitin-associated SH3 domain-containing protein